jgi:hypothetical protein
MSTRMAIRVHVEGRASRRWRGAGSEAEAAALNQKLSVQRAITVGMMVRREIATAFPKSTVVLTGTGFGYSNPRKAIPIEVEGLGSSNPIKLEDKNGNEAANRSVIVHISRVTTQANMVTKWRPAAYLSHAQQWDLEVLQFDAAAIGVGAADIRFRLTNPFSKKSRRYEARLTGPGFDNPLSDVKNPSKKDEPNKKPKPQDPTNPDKITFSTAKPIGFSAFDNNEITVWKGKAGVGIPKTPIGVQVSDTFLKFNGLGGSSDNILIDFTVEPGGLTFAGFRMKGKITAVDPHPGDFIAGTGMTDELEVNYDKGGSGIFVMFETGKSELTSEWEKHVREWTKNRAKNLAALTEMVG